MAIWPSANVPPSGVSLKKNYKNVAQQWTNGVERWNFAFHFFPIICETPSTLALSIVDVGDDMISVSMLWPINMSSFLYGQRCLWWKKSGNDFPRQGSGARTISQIEVEGSTPQYEGTFDDYLEMFIQFGYVTLFRCWGRNSDRYWDTSFNLKIFRLHTCSYYMFLKLWNICFPAQLILWRASVHS